MPSFRDIPQFTRSANYRIDVSWNYLPEFLYGEVKNYGLDLNPNFQRNHVWTRDQQVKYVEYILRGGTFGKEVYLNAPNQKLGGVGHQYKNGWFVLVDGLQRITAVLAFLNNEFPIFGENLYRHYTDRLDTINHSFSWHVNDLKTIEEVYEWYIALNSGGTVHTEEEIAKVRGFLADGTQYTQPLESELCAQAGLNRPLFNKVVEREDREKEERQKWLKQKATESVKTRKKRK